MNSLTLCSVAELPNGQGREVASSSTAGKESPIEISLLKFFCKECGAGLGKRAQKTSAIELRCRCLCGSRSWATNASKERSTSARKGWIWQKTTLHYPTLCYTVLYYTYPILSYPIPYCTALYYIVVYYTILYYTILYFTILYYAVLYCTVLYCTVLYCTVLYYTILYYTILYYTMLY